MVKSTPTIVFAVLYIALTGLQWIFLFLPYSFYDFLYDQWTYSIFFIFSGGGYLILFGALFLIPSSILFIIFALSTEGTASGKIGYGLGLPGWLLGIAGCIDAFYIIYGYPSLDTLYVPLCSTLFMIGLIIFGSLLFKRVYKVS